MFFRRPKALAAMQTVEPDEDLKSATSAYLQRLRRGEYDFLDLGTNDGGGFEIAKKLGGRNGLGFDLEPSAVRRAIGKGLDVALHDVCQLDSDLNSVDFAICSHVLEHLPDLASIEKVLFKLSRICREYILICGPLFETEHYLEQKDLKVLHSLMLDHTCKMKVKDLINILHNLELRDYLLGLSFPMRDSDNIWIHAAGQTVGVDGLWSYEPEKHLPKPSVTFDKVLHRDFVCVVKLDAAVDCDALLANFSWGFDKIVERATWAF